MISEKKLIELILKIAKVFEILIYYNLQSIFLKKT
jgi:hypothetical protein